MALPLSLKNDFVILICPYDTFEDYAQVGDFTVGAQFHFAQIRTGEAFAATE